jgi:hypothetical protein
MYGPNKGLVTSRRGKCCIWMRVARLWMGTGCSLFVTSLALTDGQIVAMNRPWELLVRLICLSWYQREIIQADVGLFFVEKLQRQSTKSR